MLPDNTTSVNSNAIPNQRLLLLIYAFISMADSVDELTQAVELLLNITRSNIADSNPEQALAALLHAVRITRGENAIFDVLNQARERATAEIDQQVLRESYEQARLVSEDLMRQNTFLSERGEEDILRDAFEDGSSLVCVKCGGLVAKIRWESHKALWCPAIDVDMTEEM